MVNVQNHNTLFSWWNHCDQRHCLAVTIQKNSFAESWSIIESYLANQFWLSAGWGRAFARGRRRRERRDVASILLVAVLVAVLVADVGARGAILVPCSGPRICTCTALLRHQPPVYMGRCSLLGRGGLVAAHNLYPSSHQPPICLVAAKLSNMFFIVLSRLSPLIWPRNWFLLMRGDPESRIHILLSHLMLTLYMFHNLKKISFQNWRKYRQTTI